MSSLSRLCCVLSLLLCAMPAQAQNKVPAGQPLEALVKASLLTFNDANVTGNYEVLHAKLSKPFRQQFSPERLKQIFREFHEKSIDFDIIAAMAPSYDPAPSVDAEGKLLTRGSFPTEPNKLFFEMEFIPSDGEWKLVRINVRIGAKP